MINIIKAQNYQLRHDMFTVILCIVIIIISVMMYFMNGADLAGGEKLVAISEIEPVCFYLISIVFAGRIAAWDYNDKTINYELLSGHSRQEIYWGRFFCSAIWCISFCAIVIGVPLLIGSLINGWGYNADLGDCVIRIVLCAIPVIRLLCEFFLLATLIQNCYATYALGYLAMGVTLMLSMVLQELTQLNTSCLLGYSSCETLLDITNYHYELVNGTEIQVYETMLTHELVGNVVISSLLVSVVCLFLGFWVFQKRDMK